MDDEMDFVNPPRKPGPTLQLQLVEVSNAQIAFLTQELCEALKENVRLRKGIEDYLDGAFGPVLRTKHDKCPHGRFGWEDCGNCIDAHFRALLEGSGVPSQQGKST